MMTAVHPCEKLLTASKPRRVSQGRVEGAEARAVSEMAAYIATTVKGREYVVLIDNKVVAGPFATAAEAVQAREALLEANSVSEVRE